MKRYLEVPNKVSNMASRAELGKYPTIIDIDKKDGSSAKVSI